MKKIEKLKLNRLADFDLSKRDMKALAGGGCCCVCGCRGSSSSWDNGNANVAGGYTPSDGYGGTGSAC